MRRHARDLVVKYTQKEMVEKSQLLAKKYTELHEIETEKKNIVAEYNEKIKGRVKELEGIVQVVKDGGEVKPVECDMNIDFDKNTVKVIRLDTQAVVSEEKLSSKDRQLELDLDKRGINNLNIGDIVQRKDGKNISFFCFVGFVMGREWNHHKGQWEQKIVAKCLETDSGGWASELDLKELTQATIKECPFKKGDKVCLPHSYDKDIYTFDSLVPFELEGGEEDEPSLKESLSKVKVAKVLDEDGDDSTFFVEELAPAKEEKKKTGDFFLHL